jgi:hypothetical protein
MIRSVAIVWPEADDWGAYRTYRRQLEHRGTAVHLLSLDHLRDVEYGLYEGIEAIATIGAPLDSARRVAARRDVPYVVLDRNPGDLPVTLRRTRATRFPVLEATIDAGLSMIALHSIIISTLDAPHRLEAQFAPARESEHTCRHRCSQTCVVFVDRRAIRVPKHAVLTVRQHAGRLREHSSS